jgi:MerR family transcriptional regulator, thiopeptide resistance regulator
MDADGLVGAAAEVLDIAALARASGVSSRTLRHYDAIGLLRPSATRADGRRRYGRAEVLQLQRILILRSLGLGLDAIGAVLAAEVDEAAALREHRARLRAERLRLDALLATVDRTIDHLEKGTPMSTEDVFAGLPGYDAEQQQEYEREAAGRWGQDAVDSSRARISGWTREDAAASMEEHAALSRDLAGLMAEGASVQDPRVQAAVARHHAWVSRFWTPDANAYEGLGRMYADDERFAATYDAFAPGLAVFLRDAIAVYAIEQLA